MVKVREEMRGMIERQFAFVGTADRDGKPNVAPKGSMRLENEETLVYSEGMGKKTVMSHKP
ncbi:MAG: pyridoxamine 5'-phosphate oxidase family protein [Euryarchaeota archaeon]|nr:pyridoxamine 5'-phosphate oxidase family protein [Euryarchaeota archaeon]